MLPPICTGAMKRAGTYRYLLWCNCKKVYPGDRVSPMDTSFSSWSSRETRLKRVSIGVKRVRLSWTS
nr:hypothetical protein Q903MT_gene1881 [Picea sitchensis]